MLSHSIPLTPSQHQVLVSLATGSTVTAAAEKAGIHRNTIANWRRSSEAFRSEYEAMHYEQAIYWRDQLQTFAPLALETLRYAMANMNTPPGVRVRAALAILDKLTALLPAPPNPKPDNVIAMPAPTAPVVDSETPHHAETEAPVQLPRPAKVAQSCTTAPPKTGRNQLCPCGSNRKYKQCCLLKPLAA